MHTQITPVDPVHKAVISVYYRVDGFTDFLTKFSPVDAINYLIELPGNTVPVDSLYCAAERL